MTAPAARFDGILAGACGQPLALLGVKIQERYGILNLLGGLGEGCRAAPYKMEGSLMNNRLEETFRFTRAVITKLNPIPMDAPFYDASMGPFDTIKVQYWMELYDEDGTVGQTPASEAMMKNVLPFVLTGKRESYKTIYDRVFWQNRNNGFCSAPFGALGQLDLAMNDILAKRAGLPLHRYWGATRDWVHVYASGHGTNTSLDALVKEAEDFKALGYTVYKMKIGTDFGTRTDEDVERVRIMREVIGPEAKLAIDANQIWSAQEAMRFFERVEKYDIYWYEEPVHSHDLWELEKICKMCPVPVSMGESLRNHYFFKAYVDAGVGQLQGNMGLMGFDDWAAVRDLAKENHLMFSGGGLPIISAFMATADEACYQEYLKPTNGPVLRYMEKKPQERDGKFYLPTTPGMPLSPDWEKLDRCQYIAGKEYLFPQP